MVFILNLVVAIKLPQLVKKCLRCYHTCTEGYFLGTIINSVPSLHPLANVWLIIASHEPHEKGYNIEKGRGEGGGSLGGVLLETALNYF